MGYKVILMLHTLLAIGLTGLILIQHGKGADAGAAFGAGSSGTVFGARGAATFLSRATALFALLFVVTSLSLAHFIKRVGPTSVIDTMDTAAPVVAAPVDGETGMSAIESSELSDGVPVIEFLDQNSGADGSGEAGDIPTLIVTPTDESGTDGE